MAKDKPELSKPKHEPEKNAKPELKRPKLTEKKDSKLSHKEVVKMKNAGLIPPQEMPWHSGAATGAGIAYF